MKTFFTKYWPSFLHAAAVAVIYADPGVHAILAAHPASSATFGLAWGLFLHWAQSPKTQFKF